MASLPRAEQRAELMKQQRELQDAKRELAVTVEKKVQETLVSVREKARPSGRTLSDADRRA